MNNVSIVVSHIDDEVLSCSGIITKTNPENLVLIYTSTSDYIDLDGTIHRTREQAITERENSLIQLLESFKLPTIIDLNYPTKEVPYNHVIIEQIDKIFRDYNIDTVFTHSYSDTHSDHHNTARAVFTASRKVPNLFTFEPIFPAQLTSLFQPNTYLDISDIYERKIKALKAQESQFRKYGSKWIDSIDALSRLRGIECGVTRSECFSTIKQRLEL
jgi:LmbE family N-acetylglucosaminyl deacetylase